ncbi:MAG: DUF1428 domain-containing protein [Myxococcaceae bacterium]|nr:DUF1428 domain-containing protein [Myxococcaceae bacterium]
MSYVDGFLLSIPKKNLDRYKKIARFAGKIWKEYGALEYRECVEDDLVSWGIPFQKRVKPKEGEVIVFSFIVYKSRAHRDRVNKLVMKDPRMAGLDKNMPFDTKRMSMAGFKTIVDL